MGSRICQFYTSYTPVISTASNIDNDNMTSLDDYVVRMKENQKFIYFFATNYKKNATKVPFVEKLMKQGYEALLMTDPLDEDVAMNLAKFKTSDGSREYEMQDVTRENSETYDGKNEKEFEDLCVFIKTILKDKIEKVVVSTRLDSSPCVLVTSKFGWSANMERIMKAQAGGDARAYEYMRGRRSLEINPSSSVIRRLLEEVRKDKESNRANEAVLFMYQTALLSSGFDLEDPQGFANTIYSLIDRSMTS